MNEITNFRGDIVSGEFESGRAEDVDAFIGAVILLFILKLIRR